MEHITPLGPQEPEPTFEHASRVDEEKVTLALNLIEFYDTFTAYWLHRYGGEDAPTPHFHDFMQWLLLQVEEGLNADTN